MSMMDRATQLAGQARENAGPYVEQARAMAAPYAEQAMDKAGQLADKAGPYVAQALDKAGPYVDQALEYAVRNLGTAAAGVDRATGGRFREQIQSASILMVDVLDPEGTRRV